MQTRIGLRRAGGRRDLIGRALSGALLGETPNLSARLQGIAEPNKVVIADGTRRLLGKLFELEDLGAKDLKGIAGPVKAWAVLRASSPESRFEALHGGGLTELVGREEELELLLRRWSRAKTGEGQVVLLSGEAGIGKSRLTAALLENLATEPHTRLRYFCSPQQTGSTFHLADNGIERAVGVLRRAGAAISASSAASCLVVEVDANRHRACRASLARFRRALSRARIGTATAQTENAGALTAQLAGLASQQPVLMIFEDAHWTDPTSLEALGRTLDRIKSLPALLIVTFRPEFNAPWVGQPHVMSLTLNRLGERDAASIIERLVGNKELPAEVLAEIVERTDGIPLFVEEMTKAVLEAEGEAEVRRTAATVPSSALAVPPYRRGPSSLLVAAHIGQVSAQSFADADCCPCC